MQGSELHPGAAGAAGSIFGPCLLGMNLQVWISSCAEANVGKNFKFQIKTQSLTLLWNGYEVYESEQLL